MDEKLIETITESESSVVSENDKEVKISPPAYNKDEKWVREYVEQFGIDPSFF